MLALGGLIRGDYLNRPSPLLSPLVLLPRRVLPRRALSRRAVPREYQHQDQLMLCQEGHLLTRTTPAVNAARNSESGSDTNITARDAWPLFVTNTERQLITTLRVARFPVIACVILA